MMRRVLFATLVTFMLVPSCLKDLHDDSITVMSLNIRYDNPDDGINAWPNRKEIVARTISDQRADIIGLQEVLKHQLDQLDSLLPAYDHIGVGRNDGMEDGEYAPVFYLADRFLLLEYRTYWLSATPWDTGSIAWDAVLPRIVTCARLHDQKQNDDFWILNTHFDHAGDTARLESAMFIRDFVETNAEGLPVILTGDFNCEPQDPPYLWITGQSDQKIILADAGTKINDPGQQPEGTFNGFGSVSPEPRIDFIFITDHWKSRNFRTLKIKEGEIFISDHYPVVSEFRLD